MVITAWQRVRMTIVMAIAFTTEHAEAMLLSAMYLAISRSLDVTASQLGTLSMWRALVQAFAIPFVGIAGNMYNRIVMIGTGTILWGAMSLGMGFSTNYAEAAAWCALNGVGLALVLPCVQSIIAEIYRARSRGKAFGLIFTTSAFGGMIVNFLAITFAQRTILTHEGWRMMFFFMAGVAGFATLVVFHGGLEPRKLKPKEAAVQEEQARKVTFWQAAYKGIAVILKSTWTVFRIKSFQIILVAGIVGAVATMGMGYKVMYFQLLGFSDVATATISTCTTLGLALGFLMGGAFGDALAVRFPNIARPFINQLSMGLAGPLSIVLYKAMPGCSKYATGVPGSLDRLMPQYGILCFSIGALASWPASNNAAIFAEVVPEAVRTSVYAFDKCIIGALGAASTPLAGLLAERVFGFTHISTKGAKHAAAPKHTGAPGSAPSPAAAAHLIAGSANNLNNARALENGLLCVMLAPMLLKFFIYFGLYWTLPRDRIEEVEDIEEGKQGDVAKGEGPGKEDDQKGGNGNGAVGSPRLPDGKGPMGGPIEASPAGRRSLSKTSSSRYSSLASGPISRDALRAGLEQQVLASALNVHSAGDQTLTADEEADVRILDRQGLGASSRMASLSNTPAKGRSLSSIARETLNLRSHSVEKYISLEMMPPNVTIRPAQDASPDKKLSV